MEEHGILGDPKAHGSKMRVPKNDQEYEEVRKECAMVFAKGMRIGLTRNLDKDRGFVNGAIGTIAAMLSQNQFVLRTDQGVSTYSWF